MAQTNGTVVVGSLLTATNNASPWLSPSGDFAFGFQKLEGSDMFLVSICYKTSTSPQIRIPVNLSSSLEGLDTQI
ncbi:hypothetical protein LguiB_001598 [Lonicera macranthoides]